MENGWVIDAISGLRNKPGGELVSVVVVKVHSRRELVREGGQWC